MLLASASLLYVRSVPCSKSTHRYLPHIRRWTTTVSNGSKPSTPVAAFAIGTMAGTLGSLAGMGGGFVMIPLMTSILRLNQHTAHGTSLFAVAATGIAGAVSYGDAVQWSTAAAVTATAMVTSRLGARTTISMSERSLKRALGYLMLAMAPAVPAKAYLMDHQSEPMNGKQLLNAQGSDDTFNFRTLLPAAGVGLASGYLSGVFGVGGGVIVVPALTVSCPDFTHRDALATSLAAMCLPAIIGTVTHYQAGNCSIAVAPFLALGALVGAYVGGKISLQTDEVKLRWGFSILLTVLGIRTLVRS